MLRLLLTTTLILVSPLTGAEGPGAERPAPLLDDGQLLVMRGTLPLVLSAPHGGSASPEGWERRSGGVQVQDRNTLPLVEALAEALRRRTGRMPSVVASLVHRRYLDLNRDRWQSGARLGAEQEELWSRYHGSLESLATEALGHGAGSALVIDLHGHGHPHGLVELGHALSASQLRGTDEELEDAAWVRGPRSLGARLDALGVASVPSPERPAPEPGQPYFDGGYTVRRHRGGGLRAIQIELPPDPRRPDAKGRQPLVDALADALVQVLMDHEMLPPVTLATGPAAELGAWGPGIQPWDRPRWRSLAVLAGPFPDAAIVLGVPVLAKAESSEASLLEGARRIALLLDSDADGRVDDPEGLLELQRSGRTYGIGDLVGVEVLRLPPESPWEAPVPLPTAEPR